jgi:tetratricopeptide (TPR) repeat protein
MNQQLDSSNGVDDNQEKHELTPAEIQKNQETKELKALNLILNSGQLEKALEGYKDFQKKYPRSELFYTASFGIAQTKEFLGLWDEAIQDYRDLVQLMSSQKPDLAALALYRLSFCYEAQGKDERVIATLLDARSQAVNLDESIAQAAIPARLAAAYNRSLREDDAVIELNKAQKGLDELIRKKRAQIDKKWLAETYLEMGTYSTNQLSNENFFRISQTLRVVQGFLIRTMELDLQPYSQKASILLKDNYKDLWNAVLTDPLNTQIERMVADHEKQKNQRVLTVEILKMIAELQQKKALEEVPINESMINFYSYISELEQKGLHFLMSTAEVSKSTHETTFKIFMQNPKKKEKEISDPNL